MKTLKNIFWISIPFVLVGYIIYKIIMNSFAGSFMDSDPQHIKAVIIDKKNFMGNHPVDPLFTYSYSFTVNGVQYTGNSHDTSLHVGDSVAIEYNKNHPRINKPVQVKN